MPSDLQKFIDERLTTVGKAAYEAIAEVVTEEATQCYENIKDGTPTRTGALKASLTLTQVEDHSQNRQKFGFKIDYEGYNDKGVAYSKIGRTLNKGTSRIQGKHFIDKAVRKLKGMDERINQRFIDKVDKGR